MYEKLPLAMRALNLPHFLYAQHVKIELSSTKLKVIRDIRIMGRARKLYRHPPGISVDESEHEQDYQSWVAFSDSHSAGVNNSWRIYCL